ncbi:hypothetical protein NM688_g955 [Phlebia brevispora]|uniref:Uncharacterized protein n=1 Tax=Phlebia brevispora TaxID=194682 RepID=A0ACC1TD59_9APHY|nr:hypothetical protein NM688_g955 [Phlebia brevispora]
MQRHCQCCCHPQLHGYFGGPQFQRPYFQPCRTPPLQHSTFTLAAKLSASSSTVDELVFAFAIDIFTSARCERGSPSRLPSYWLSLRARPSYRRSSPASQARYRLSPHPLPLTHTGLAVTTSRIVKLSFVPASSSIEIPSTPASSTTDAHFTFKALTSSITSTPDKRVSYSWSRYILLVDTAYDICETTTHAIVCMASCFNWIRVRTFHTLTLCTVWRRVSTFGVDASLVPRPSLACLIA